jgi:glycine cleavage system transcriptional repressor
MPGMEERRIMVISVMAEDRPGIVAEVSESISALGGNLADLRESVLCGYFTMILMAGFPPAVTPDKIGSSLAGVTGAEVSVMPHEGDVTDAGYAGEAYVLSAVGLDRVGLVAQVSRFCCDRGVNILDLATHVEGDQYTMMLLIDLSGVPSVQAFKQELSELGAASGLNLALRHNDIFRATNEI